MLSGWGILFATLGLGSCRSTSEILTLDVRAKLNRADFSIPSEIAALEDDERIQIDGDRTITKADYMNLTKIAEKCHHFLTSVSENLRIQSTDGKIPKDMIIMYNPKPEWRQVTGAPAAGLFHDLRQYYCHPPGHQYYLDNVYPYIFNELKLAAEQHVASFQSIANVAENSDAAQNDYSDLIQRYARRYRAITAEDPEFSQGVLLRDERLVGRKLIYDGLLGIKRQGYYEVMGFPPILVSATAAFGKYKLHERVIIVVQITGVRSWLLTGNDQRTSVYTSKLIKIIK